MASGEDGLAALRRTVVLGVLGLLVFVVVADVLDGILGANSFQVDLGFYTMVAGIILGLFGATAIAAVRNRE